MEPKGEWSLKAVEQVVERNTCRQGENCTSKTPRLTVPPTTFFLEQYFGPQTEDEHTFLIFYDTAFTRLIAHN